MIHRRNVVKFMMFVFGLIAIVYLIAQTHKLNKPASVITISTYEEALFELDKVDKNTLVLFDVDGTLITSPALNVNYFTWWFKVLFAIMHPTLINTNWENAYSKMWTHRRNLG